MSIAAAITAKIHDNGFMNILMSFAINANNVINRNEVIITVKDIETAFDKKFVALSEISMKSENAILKMLKTQSLAGIFSFFKAV